MTNFKLWLNVSQQPHISPGYVILFIHSFICKLGRWSTVEIIYLHMDPSVDCALRWYTLTTRVTPVSLGYVILLSKDQKRCDHVQHGFISTNWSTADVIGTCGCYWDPFNHLTLAQMIWRNAGVNCQPTLMNSQKWKWSKRLTHPF